MMYRIIKIWYNGGKEIIESTEDGHYANNRVAELNRRIDRKQKNHPLKYKIETF